MKVINQKKVLYILASCSFLLGLDSFIVSPLVPQISRSLDFPILNGGLLITAYALLYGVSAPLFGPFSDKFGRKKMLVLGLIIFIMGTALTAISFNLTSILLFRALSGLGGAVLMPSVYAYVGDIFSYEQRGKAMGVIMGAMVGSTIIGVPFGTFFSEIVSWKWVFIIISILSIFVIFFVTIALPRGEAINAPGERNILRIYKNMFRMSFTNVSIIFALLSTFLWMAGLQGMFANVGAFYTMNYSLSVTNIGFVYLFAGITNVWGNFYGGKLSDKKGKKTVVSVATILAAVGVLLFSASFKNVYLVILIQMFWSFSNGLGYASLTALISELDPKIRGTILSLNSSAVYLGMTVSTAVATGILSLHNFFYVGLFCGASNLLVLPILNYLVKEKSASETLSDNSGTVV